MTNMRWLFALPALLVAAALLMSGCTQQAEKQEKEIAKAETNKAETNADKDGGHNLDGYWCVEHGVPEELCSLCNAEKAKEYKEKGDWCEKHNRAKSQCFKCDPSKYERFAAMYKARVGKEPPRPPETEFKE